MEMIDFMYEKLIWSICKDVFPLFKVIPVWKLLFSFPRHRILFPLKKIFQFWGTARSRKGARSGLYGSWRSWTMPCFARYCWISWDERAGALPCRCSNRSPLFFTNPTVSFTLLDAIVSKLLRDTTYSPSFIIHRFFFKLKLELVPH